MTATATRTRTRKSSKTTKATKAKASKPVKGESKKADPVALEAAYRKRWPNLAIVPGSFVLAGELADFPKKHSVELACTVCDEPHRRATQDAWQCRVCHNPECRKAMKKAEAANAPKNGKKGASK